MKLFLFFFCFALTTPLCAQIDMGVPSAAGRGGASTAMAKNWETIGINPSNLGWNSNYKFSMSIGNVGLSAQSRALNFAGLKNAILHPSDTFTTAEKQNYANLFTNQEGFNMTANFTWLAASFYLPKLGGLAFNVRDRAYAHVGLNQNAADILFNGRNAAIYSDSSVYTKNISDVFDGCNITYLHFREANLSYGRRVAKFGAEDGEGNPAVQIFAGAGVKYIWGFANTNAEFSNGQITGQSSFSTNYSINYGNIQNFTPEGAGSIFNNVGTGMGFDLGASVILKNKIRFAAAVTDIGSITWTNNVLFGSDTTMPRLDSTNYGMNNWEMSSQSEFLFGDDGFMNYKPGEDFKSSLPTRLRLGVGITLGKRIDLGADLVIPMNKTLYNLSNPYLAIGADIKIFEVLKLNAGISGSADLGWNVPMGITIGPLGFFEIGLATGDVLTFIDKSRNPNISVCMGFLRFNLGNKKDAGANVPPTPGI